MKKILVLLFSVMFLVSCSTHKNCVDKTQDTTKTCTKTKPCCEKK